MSLTLALGIAAALSWIGVYILACTVIPFGTCRRCHGHGHLPNGGRGWRTCARCDATGKRVRLGRRVYEHLRAEQRAGTRPQPRTQSKGPL